MSSIKEKSRQVLGKVSAGLQSGVDQAQAELGKLESQAAGASDATRVRTRAKIGETRGKQEAGWEKMRTSLEQQISEAEAEIRELESAASGVSGDARERIMSQADKTRSEREEAHAKLVNSLESEAAEAENEMMSLEKEATEAGGETAERIMMRAGWARMRRDTMQERLEAIRQPVPQA
jgi:hypothetical protein